MKQVNIEETRELIKGLENVSLENIDTYLQKQGVVVDVSIGRKRIPISLDPKIYGINVDNNEELSKFFQEHVKSSKLVFISKKYEKRLQSLESAVRLKRNDMAIGYDNKYMPLETYKEFQKYFNEKKTEYFRVLEEIVDSWKEMSFRFSQQLDYVFQELNSIDREKIKTQIWSKIPTVEDYKDSFYMDTQLRAFPVMSNVSILDNDLSEAIRDRAIKDNINSVYDIIMSTLRAGFLSLSSVYEYYGNNDTLTSIQLKKIDKLEVCLKRNNLLKNQLIEDIISEIERMKAIPDIDEKVEVIEIIIIKIYKFANDIGQVSKLPLGKCPISAEDLDTYAENLI